MAKKRKTARKSSRKKTTKRKSTRKKTTKRKVSRKKTTKRKKTTRKKAAKKKAKKKAPPGTGRCMRCQKQVKIQNGKVRITKNKMRMLMGSCPKCGTTCCRILGRA